MSIGHQPRHAPLEPQPLLGHVYLALWVDVQPVAAIELVEHLIHALLIDSRAAHNRQRLAQAEEERVSTLAEADLACAQRPPEMRRVRIGKVFHRQYGAEEKRVVHH